MNVGGDGAGPWPTPQQRLLLKAALLPGQAATQAWTELRPTLDVDHMDIESYRLLPLVHHNLRAVAGDDPELPRLRGLARHTWYCNQLLFRDLGAVLSRLHAAGVETMVLKGVALVAQYYAGAGLRPMADADVLVPAARASAVLDLLEGEGWQRTSFRSLSQERLIRAGPAVNLAREGRRLDLHWHLATELLLPGRWAESSDDFWAASVDLDVNGVATRALSPADQLLHVCVHGLRWGSDANARWAADAWTVIDRAGATLDWGRLVDQAVRRQAVPTMRATLGYLAGELEAPVPAAVLDELGRRPVSRRQAWAHQRRLRPPPTRRGRLRGVGLVEAYIRDTAGWPLRDAVVGVPRYLADRWGAERGRDLPFAALSKARGRLTRRLPAPKSSR